MNNGYTQQNFRPRSKYHGRPTGDNVGASFLRNTNDTYVTNATLFTCLGKVESMLQYLVDMARTDRTRPNTLSRDCTDKRSDQMVRPCTTCDEKDGLRDVEVKPKSRLVNLLQKGHGIHEGIIINDITYRPGSPDDLRNEFKKD